MNDHFKASVVAFEVQKSFASKFFSNKTVAKSLIDDTSARLLDNLYLLLKVFVSSYFTSIKYCNLKRRIVCVCRTGTL
jgi:hypothetical protein